MNTDQLLLAHRSFNALLKELALGMNLHALNKAIIHLAEELFDDRLASILKLDEVNKTLHCVSAPNLPSFYNKAIEGVEIGENVGSCGAAAYLKTAVIVEDINTHPNWSPYTELTQQANLHACWSMPILSSAEKVLGTFAIYSSKPSVPGEFELEVLEMAASIYAVALEKFDYEQQLYQTANYDSLTNTLNRNAFINKTNQLIATKKHSDQILALFFIDIDKFKLCNDNYGHAFGDLVLSHTSNCLRALSRESDLLGRFGGDEFILVCSVHNHNEALKVYKRLENYLTESLYVENKKITASIGVASCAFSEIITIESLIEKADKKMYQHKGRQQETF
ncbi:sensor domain-containing diguanylate cyclase [Vibrio sp. Of7-15]|uniref:sensor domain-containing diguanylate cyclase n=1 Tax=Vibrio sp. Of7-15 TaxID=2724879 RepID=UPI001EF23D5A|nr:sensor domain-containing diguanylate cyclase [Vibrio sp. Of7-15]MCG7495686.1 sensor domain-containing diguanylate cyclase [Vibrio sp. Of7-15]